MTLTENSSPEVVQFYLKKIKTTQAELANELGVTPSAVSRAIKNDDDTYLKELRKRIIGFIKKHKQLQAA